MIKMVRIVSGLDQSPSNQTKKKKKVKLLDWLLTRHSSTHEHSKWRCMLGPFFFFLLSTNLSSQFIYLKEKELSCALVVVLFDACHVTRAELFA